MENLSNIFLNITYNIVCAIICLKTKYFMKIRIIILKNNNGAIAIVRKKRAKFDKNDKK